MRILALLLFLTVFTSPVCADAPKHVEPRLYSPVTATGTGDTVPLALELVMEEHWDTYWRSPGDAGLPPDLDFAGSDNLKSYDMQWPAPIRQTVQGIENNIYVDKVTFPLTVALKTPGAPLDIKLKLGLLVCNEICVPEKYELSFQLPAGAAEKSEDAPAYEAALKKIPRGHVEGYSFGRAWLEFKDDAATLAVEASSPRAPTDAADLFVEHESFIPFGRPHITYDDAAKKMMLRLPIHATDPPAKLTDKLSQGDFTLTFTDEGMQGVEGKTMLGAEPETAPQKMPAPQRIKEKLDDISIGIILAALLGGLILNLMPCVLPVLSLKVLSVVSHGGDHANRRTVFRNFMASAAGIIFSFWVMAGGLVALKAAGGSIGWGIQFQHPGFLAFLLIVVLCFAANMWGLFEIPLPRFIANKIASRHEQEPTLAGHFLTGAFATLLATPCTAPFLGTAIGFALARGAYEIFAIFTFIGIGLALPYILLAVSPGLFRFMPKPGPWMVRLKRVLAIALLVTAMWLAQVLMNVTTMPAIDPDSAESGWSKLDTSKIAPAVAEGKTVFVDVTADWCLTCKANKKFVLDTDDIKTTLAAPNIVLMEGDYTQQDEGISAYLHSFGRYGIPFNVVYGPGAPDGIALPELLTKEAVTDALAEAAGE